MVEINNDARETYRSNTQIKCKTTILKSSLWDSVMYIYLLKGI